jgi:hypothetical protein
MIERYDIIYVNPFDYTVADKLFRDTFSDWSFGYERWGSGDYKVKLVEDKKIERGTAVGVSVDNCFDNEPMIVKIPLKKEVVL